MTREKDEKWFKRIIDKLKSYVNKKWACNQNYRTKNKTNSHKWIVKTATVFFGWNQITHAKFEMEADFISKQTESYIFKLKTKKKHTQTFTLIDRWEISIANPNELGIIAVTKKPRTKSAHKTKNTKFKCEFTRFFSFEFVAKNWIVWIFEPKFLFSDFLEFLNKEIKLTDFFGFIKWNKFSLFFNPFSSFIVFEWLFSFPLTFWKARDFYCSSLYLEIKWNFRPAVKEIRNQSSSVRNLN